MKIVFLQNVEGSGRIGEIKEVANGFARNYLLPRRLAAPATPDAIRRGEARAAVEARRQAELDEQARALAERMAPPIIITARVGEQGRLYGSVTAGDIAEEVSKLVGEEIDRHLVVIEEPIKALGTYEIPLRLTHNVKAVVTVEVVGESVAAEEEEEKEEEEEEKKATKRKRKAKAVSEEEGSGPAGSAEAVEEGSEVEAGQEQGSKEEEES